LLMLATNVVLLVASSLWVGGIQPDPLFTIVPLPLFGDWRQDGLHDYRAVKDGRGISWLRCASRPQSARGDRTRSATWNFLCCKTIVPYHLAAGLIITGE